MQRYITRDHNKGTIRVNEVFTNLEGITIGIKDFLREDFNSLSPWILCLKENSQGFALRLGVAKKSPVNLLYDKTYMYFCQYICPGGYIPNDKDIETQLEKAKEAVMGLSKKIAENYLNTKIASLMLNQAPEWMMQDLRDNLNKNY